MRSGEAPIAEVSSVEAMVVRKWSRKRPLPAGVVSALTLVFWAGWLYLVLPLVSLVLWVFGVRFFIREIAEGGYEALRASLLAYSSVLLVLVGLLALWIAWNVVRYGGDKDRRTAKREEVDDSKVREAFELDDSLFAMLRGERFVRIDLDGEGCVVMTGATPPRVAGPVVAMGPAVEVGPDGGGLQRDRDSTRSG
jgi:poly-beta-1,6-N-acetyl-D-glucosamine biosynthesis protein PgaD